MAKFADLMNNAIATGNLPKQQGIKTFTYTPPNFKPKSTVTPLLPNLDLITGQTSANKTDLIIKGAAAKENKSLLPGLNTSKSGTGFGFDPEADSDPNDPTKAEMIQLKQYKKQANQSDADKKKYEDYKLSLDLPTTGERVKNFFTGNAKDYGGTTVNAVTTLQDFTTDKLGVDDVSIEQAYKDKLIKEYEDKLKDPNLSKMGRWYYENKLEKAKEIKTMQDYSAKAEELIQGGAEDLAVTKKGLSDAAKTGVDIGSAGIQLAGDAAIAYATGGSALLPMGTRSFGSGAYSAKQAGGTLDDQVLYGALNAGTAVLTERLFNVGKVFTKIYGKGAADDVIQGAMNRAINKYVSSDVGKAVANRIGTGVTAGVGEGFEEMIQSSLDPLYQKVTFNPDAKLDLEQVFYDGLIGGSIGFLVGGAGGGNVNTNMPNINTPQQAVQAPTIASNVQTTTDAAKAIEPPTVSPVSPQNVSEPNTTSVGAAPQNFAKNSDKLTEKYQDAIDTYGAMPERANLARQMEVPQSVSDGTVIPQTAQTIMGSELTPSDFAGEMTDLIAQGKLSKAVYADADAIAKTESVIADKGYQQSLADWTADVKSGKASKDITAMGITLYNNAVNSGEYQTASNIVADMIDNARSVGQALQAMNLFNKLTPQGQLYSLQRSVQNLSEELSTKFAKKGFEGITLDESLVKQFLEAKTDAERESAMDAIKDNVASQVPSTWYDKWNAWRYLAMLGNPRTHIRNIIGNAGFAPVRAVKNVLATGGEKLLGVENRTKAILTKADKQLIEQARFDYDIVSEQILSQGKFDNMTGDINSRRQIFNNPILEALRTGNSKLLDKEDVLFAKPAYSNALAGWYKANGITAEQLQKGTVEQKTIDSARAYAIKEAQKATYRDSNDFSDFVAKLGSGYKGNNKAAKVANVLIEGVLPFKRTPANILARSVEYSPIGLAKGLTYDLIQVKNGNMEASQAIDNISAGLTGLGILGLGVWLASTGIVTGGKDDDDKTAQLDSLQGYQSYAINIGGKSFTLDWLAPEAMPFFVGVEIFNSATDKSENGVTFSEVLSKVSNITEPMLNMSMLQGVEDLFKSVKYSEGNVGPSVAATTAVNYLSQGLPTLFGQLERIAESERQTTFTDKTSGIPTAVQSMLGKVGNKIPFVDYKQVPYRDGFGNTQSSGTVLNRILNNMINPAYVSDIKADAVTGELSRLNEGNYLTSVPDAPEKDFDYKGKNYVLSAKEYSEYQKTAGQLTYNLMQTMIDSNAYEKMTDEQKAEAISQIMSYANDMAKREYVGSSYKSSDFEKVYEAEQKGINPTDYFAYKSALKELDTDDSPTQVEITKAIEETDLSKKYKGELWQIQNSDSSPEKNPYTGTLAQKGLSPEKNIAIMEAYSKIDKAMENYVKPEGGASKAHIQAAYLKQWLAKNGYSTAQINAITDVFITWQMIPVDKPSKKALAFVSANPMP